MEGFYPMRLHRHPNYTLTDARASGDITEESILSLIAVLGSSISLVGLVFAFITYSLFSDLRNLSGTALMNFLAALFMTQLLYVIGVGGVQDAALCIGLAFSLQYMRLTVFCWLLLMSHYTYCMFRDNISLLPQMNPNIRSTFWLYTLFGWCTPITFLLPSVFLQWKKTGNLLSVKSLQSGNCWFVYGDAFLYGYSLPTFFLFSLVVFTLIRMVFVIRQSVSIQIDRRTRDKMRSKRRLQLCLYVKLTSFISMVSLISILYTQTKKDVFWILFNALQGTQGIVITLCVTCNCQVLKIYTRSLKKQRKYSQYDGIGKDLSKSTSLQLLTWDPFPELV